MQFTTFKKSFSSIIFFLAIFASPVSLAQYPVTGTVKNEAGEPLVSASVLLDPGAHATVTEADGTFSFVQLSGGMYTIRISFIGYDGYEEEFNLVAGKELRVALKRRSVEQKEVLINATRAGDNEGFVFTILEKDDIEKSNTGKDLPYLLAQTPSLVTTSDAGTGIGYTGVRIRGSDASRINVTLNGVPLNDAESQQVYFVDLPDLASSVENIQVQRGVGTSSNGAGSFGGSINIMTGKLGAVPFVSTSHAAGSFNTFKNNISIGTGLIRNHWAFEGRLSRIVSDGYIDRASADLKSYALTGGYFGKKSMVKFTMLSGREVTYQAWNGVPESLLSENRTYNAFTYENQVDDYRQDHYQLLLGHDFSPLLQLQVTFHATRGKGFYEEFREDDPFSSYGLPDLIIGGDTLVSTDLVRRKWLDNIFYGSVFALSYKPSSKIKATLGGAWNQYDGSHFSRITWAGLGNIAPDHRYENDNALKTDISVYVKCYYEVFAGLTITGDLQVRNVDYRFTGFDQSLLAVPQKAGLFFFNPKFAVSWAFKKPLSWYASISKGSREPSRDDYTESSTGSRPLAETMADLETGFRYQSGKIKAGLNYFLMNYNNQLVLTGKINDVGNYTRVNVPSSYRQGVEAESSYSPASLLSLHGNITISENKIRAFDEYIDNYDDGSQQLVRHTRTDLAFSPSLTASGTVSIMPLKNLSVDLLAKHVGRQYLDNTSNRNRMIGDYTVFDARLNYSTGFKSIREVKFTLLAANIFSRKYVSNGYTFSYVYGGEFTTENYYYPQALFNMMGQVTVSF